MSKTRFGNYHPSGYTPPSHWTQDERFEDMERIAKLIERGGHTHDDIERLKKHLSALLGVRRDYSFSLRAMLAMEPDRDLRT